MSTITLQENGPITIKTIDGNNVALCRCGLTDDMPYCDGSHVPHGFNAKGMVVLLQCSACDATKCCKENDK